MSAPARYITQPTPGRSNLLVPAERIAEALGLTMMPWQTEVIGTLTERLSDGSPAFTDATIGTPRQAGKSTTIEILMLLEALSGPNRHIAYTSTTGGAARAMLMDILVPTLRASRLNGTFDVRATNGSERVKFRDTGSTISILSSAKHAGHGSTLSAVFLDEIWNAEDWIEQVRPTLITTGGVWYGFSTAGAMDGSSEYLLGRCERGRADVDAGVTEGRFYAEWSIDLADIGNVDAYVQANPAVGFTIKAEDIVNAVKGMDRSEAARAYGNAWTAATNDPIIDLDVWQSLEDNTSKITGDLVLSVDVAPNRTHVSVSAAGKNAEGLYHVEVIDSRDGTAWLPQRLADLVKIHHPKCIFADQMSASLVPDLERVLGINIRLLTASEHATAHAFLIEQVNAGTLRHPTDTELVQALMAATVRPLSDGGSAWSRRNSSINIDPIVSVTIALHGAHTLTGTVGFWSLDTEVARMRAESWNPDDPYQIEAFHRLLDTQPPERWQMLLTARGFSKTGADQIIAHVMHGAAVERPEYADRVLPQRRAWNPEAFLRLDPAQVPQEAPTIFYPLEETAG